METAQSHLNAELFGALQTISQDEALMNRAVKYLKKLASEKQGDATLMSKEEFFRRIDDAQKGTAKSFANVEELDQFIRAL